MKPPRAVLLLLACVGAYLWLYLPQIPASGTPWGHDYALHLPNLLAGQYWFHANGPFAVPWFNPGQCAGVPYFGDLNVAYYSLPQWAMFAFGPIAAVRITFVIFALLGAGGFYLLLRGPFAASPWAAASAAVLFLFGGFFAQRMIVGHLTFHPFTLAPWLAWAFLAGGAGRRFWPVALGGLIFAYMFHAGMVHGIAPVALAVAAILLVHGQAHGHRAAPWLLFAAAALAAIALSAQRLAAGLAFLQQFPRDEYDLPGFASLADALQILLRALFWRPPVAQAPPLLSNLGIALERHEWEYGLGPAAALLLVAGAVTLRRPRSWLAAGVIVAVLAVPILLNWHQAQWHALLKSLPVLGSSSNLVRWFALYVPLLALFAGLALDRAVPAGRWRAFIAVLAAAATVAWNATAERGVDPANAYNAAAIEQGWRALRAGAPVPAVTHLSVRVDKENRLLVPQDRNDDIARGYSQLLCYQPMFGYGLERLRFGALHPGPALDELGDGTLNLKNPACYQFPGANGCVPGDHFRLGQRDAAAHFLSYEPFEFHRPAWQLAADAITIAALLALLAALGAEVLRVRFSAGSRPGSR